jgi:N-dimethylarginine dimethylaminohydrolase
MRAPDCADQTVRYRVTTFFDEYQEQLYQRRWTWDDIPFYEGRGAKQSIAPLHDLDYLDVYERVYGRKMGCNGIGKLREVALTVISEVENQVYDERYPYAADAAFLEAHGLGRVPDIDLCREQQENYASVLEGEGVTVHWIDWGDAPMGAYGPLQATWAAQELLVLNGGAVVPKLGWHPFSFGRTEFLAHWAFWNLNIPTLLTISGKGAVCEAGATVWLAQDVFVVGLSAAYNRAGLEQLLSTVELTSGVDDLKVLTIRCQGALYFDRNTGASAHVTNLLAPLDVDKVLAYKPGIDTATLLWLEQHGYDVVEADFQEHVQNDVCNLKILEPGRVVMAAEAKNTIAKVRAAGVEVIEVPYSGFQHAGGGFHCTTMEIYREPGPLMAER